MRVGAVGGEAVGPVEREMLAHEAHASATVLAVLTFLWGAVAIFLVPRQFRIPNLVHIAAGGIALGYFVRTRRRPNLTVAYAFSAAAIVQALALLPWTTVVWCDAHRPFEAVIVPQVAMFCMALVVPRSLALGVAVMGLFLLEGLFVTVYATHVGEARLLPVGEPWETVMFCIPAVGLLLLRERRRRLARRHIHLHAETEALSRLGPLLARVRKELFAQLTVLSDQLRAAGSDGAPTLATPAGASMERAVGRLVDVDARLDALVDPRAVETPPPSPPSGDATEPERSLLARDAQLGAGGLAIIVAAVALVWAGVAHADLTTAVMLSCLGAGIVALVVLAVLVATRRRPSQRRSHVAILVVFVVTLVAITLNQRAFLGTDRPFTPFVGHKMLMVTLGLAAASWSSMGLPLIILTAADALVLYYVLGFGALKDRIAIVEPWITLVFLVVGVAALVLRDQRRVASLALLRAESEASTLHRRALTLLALRDQLNTPLQTLVVGLARLELHDPSRDLSRIRGAVDRLVALSRELAQIEIPSGSHVASLGAGGLQRAHPIASAGAGP